MASLDSSSIDASSRAVDASFHELNQPPVVQHVALHPPVLPQPVLQPPPLQVPSVLAWQDAALAWQPEPACQTVSSFQERRAFQSELGALNEESERVAQELGQVKAEVSILRHENAVLQKQRFEWEGTRKTLSSENTQLWEQLREHKQHISNLTDSLQQLQQQMQASAQTAAPPVLHHAAATQAVPHVTLTRDHKHSDAVTNSLEDEVQRLRAELVKQNQVQHERAQAWNDERGQLLSELQQAQVVTPCPTHLSEQRSEFEVVEQAEILEDLKRRMAQKLEALQWTPATPAVSALAPPRGASRAAVPVAQGELARRLLDLKAQMSAAEHEGEHLYRVTATVEDEYYRQLGGQSQVSTRADSSEGGHGPQLQGMANYTP